MGPGVLQLSWFGKRMGAGGFALTTAVFCVEIQKKLCQQHQEVSLSYKISQD